MEKTKTFAEVSGQLEELLNQVGVLREDVWDLQDERDRFKSTLERLTKHHIDERKSAFYMRNIAKVALNPENISSREVKK